MGFLGVMGRLLLLLLLLVSEDGLFKVHFTIFKCVVIVSVALILFVSSYFCSLDTATGILPRVCLFQALCNVAMK